MTHGITKKLLIALALRLRGWPVICNTPGTTWLMRPDRQTEECKASHADGLVDSPSSTAGLVDTC